MTTSARLLAAHVATARRIAGSVARRAALHEAIGAVRGWDGGTVGQAGERFGACDGDVQRDAEVARVAAEVEATADRRADPDWGG
ncbi:hypothetical protein ADK67_12245 [Saccharothrix sp. NRRL B-16348]|uniref:hypothetical protein n=1 Tax=Saccharothrix sp. NRRL B-16348 TaxID=1415542 RepID=UPI0006AE43CB|nr:hypothetical protein [Saccharothrix sp. NRRL B-16348]KOX28193.1 hypothetical protein ADK67_12245 [Saccharothrix sp. NRRL B-16348]